MALSPLPLNSHILDGLSAVGLLCFLYSALRLAGIKPATNLGKNWQTLKTKFKSSKFGWPGVGVRTKRLEINSTAQQALAQLIIVGPQLLILCGVFYLATLGAIFYAGYLYHDSREFHETYVLTNAVVDQQHGDFVTYHFEDDPTREPYALNFTCSNYKPHFKPHQIIAKMTYTRKEDCESLDGPQYVLKLRRINGVPILEGE